MCCRPLWDGPYALSTIKGQSLCNVRYYGIVLIGIVDYYGTVLMYELLLWDSPYALQTIMG